MNEKDQAYLALQYAEEGEKAAVYDRRLKRPLCLPDKRETWNVRGKPAVLVCPVAMTAAEKCKAKDRSLAEGYAVRYMMSEAEAITRFQLFQNHGSLGTEFVKVINIHTYYTDLTLVRIQGDVVTPVLCQKIMTGGQQLTFNLTEYYMNKLRRVNGDIRGDHASIHMLRDMAEEAKLRVAGNRLPEDAFIFRSPKDHIKYRLRVFREDYEKMAGEIMETIFRYDAKLVKKSAAYGYPAPGIVLLAGGMSECDVCAEAARRNYGNIRVVAYKGKSAALLGAAGWLAEKEGAYGMDRSAGQYVQYGTAL